MLSFFFIKQSTVSWYVYYMLFNFYFEDRTIYLSPSFSAVLINIPSVCFVGRNIFIFTRLTMCCVVGDIEAQSDKLKNPISFWEYGFIWEQYDPVCPLSPVETLITISETFLYRLLFCCNAAQRLPQAEGWPGAEGKPTCVLWARAKLEWGMGLLGHEQGLCRNFVWGWSAPWNPMTVHRGPTPSGETLSPSFSAFQAPFMQWILACSFHPSFPSLTSACPRHLSQSPIFKTWLHTQLQYPPDTR